MKDPRQSRPIRLGPARSVHPDHTSGADWFARSNVLVLCGTGACLSPLTAAMLRAEAQKNNLAPHLTFSPAGLHTAGGFPCCAEAQALSPAAFAATASAAQPRSVTRDLVAQADLVLVMRRCHKADIRMLDPRSPQRTFTLREAAVLGRSMADRHLRMGQAQLPTAGLGWFVGELDSLRGLVATGEPTSRWWSRFRRGSDPLDLDDPHTDGGTHRHAIMQINVAARELTAALATTTSLGEGTSKPKAPGRHRRH